MQILCFLLDFMSWWAHDKHLQRKFYTVNQEETSSVYWCQLELLLIFMLQICSFGRSKNCPKKTFCTHRGLSGSVSISIPHPPLCRKPEFRHSFGFFWKGGGPKKTSNNKTNKTILGKCFWEVSGWHSCHIFVVFCSLVPLTPYPNKE